LSFFFISYFFQARALTLELGFVNKEESEDGFLDRHVEEVFYP